MYSNNFAIVAITETWLQDFIFDNEILPFNYTIYRNDRQSKGGGIMIALNNHLSSKGISTPDDLELTAVYLHQYHLTICVVYITPNTPIEYHKKLYDYLDTLPHNEHILLIGDFNAPDIEWDTYSCTCCSSELLCDFVVDYNFTQFINKPTHVHNNILDLIITNRDNLIQDIFIHPVEDFIIQSDHLMITFSLTMPLNHLKTKSHITGEVLDYSKADWHGLNNFFLNHYATLSKDNIITDVESFWTYLKDLIIQGSNLFIPRKQTYSKTRPKWLSSTIQHKLNCLHTLRKKVKVNPTEANTLALVEAEKALQSEIEKSKQEIEADLIRQFEHSNNNEIYKYISNLTNTRGLPDTMTNGNDTVTGGPEIASCFNEYFYSVFTKDDSQPQQPEFVSSFSTESISFSVSDVFNIMSTLNTTKATGIDGISPVLLKSCASSLSTPVHTLFLLSITRGTLPKEWKTHLITPIFKSGDKADIRNYRPVSLLCILSKVLEKLIYNSLSEFVSNRISTQQFGFTKGRSSLQQLLVYFSNVVDATDGSASVDVMYLDLCKAFDSVTHTKLLHKLHTYGISGKLWNWFKSYLHDRQQCVRVGNAISGFLPVLSGVPQGSILGPLLFLLYINDLPDCLETSIMYMFADDSKCMHIIWDFNDTIAFQDDLNSVYHWSQTWKLKFNLSKTAFIQFGNNSASSSNYLLNGTTVYKQTSTKDLGIIVTSEMSWSNHYKSIASKAYKSLGLIRRTFKSNSVHAKKLLYISLVRSKLTYCSQLWRPQYI